MSSRRTHELTIQELNALAADTRLLSAPGVAGVIADMPLVGALAHHGSVHFYSPDRLIAAAPAAGLEIVADYAQSEVRVSCPGSKLVQDKAGALVTEPGMVKVAVFR